MKNSAGDFGTKLFSIFGAKYSSGPWGHVYSGELEQGNAEVLNIFFFFFKTITFAGGVLSSDQADH